MSEEQIPYGAEADRWRVDADEIRVALETMGLTQIAAAKELDISERAVRGYLSGREPVPRVIQFAVHYMLMHRPRNERRWLQIHWRKFSYRVQPGEKFDFEPSDDGYIRISRSKDSSVQPPMQIINSPLSVLVERGLVSVHKSYSSDRFEIPAEYARRQGVE